MENTNAVTVINPACEELTGKIKGAMYNIAKEFVYIGFLLAECDYFESYKVWGYSSIHEYASHQLGFKKSSTYNFINVCKTFCQPTKALPFSYFMKEPYSKFNFSQLVEMLSMNDKQCSQVTPDMTIKQIRGLKKVDVPASEAPVDDSRRLEEAPAPEAPSAPAHSDVDYYIPHSDDVRILFNDIEDFLLYNDDFEGKDLYDVVIYFFKNKKYVIMQEVK